MRGWRSTGCSRLAEPLGQSDVRRALAEDLASGDVTTRLLGAAAARAAALRFVAEAPFVVAGLSVVELTFQELDPQARIETHIADAAWAEPGVTVATVRAQARALLSGERVPLNFLHLLSATAPPPPPTLHALPAPAPPT